eukprot:61265-Chlamydomonas_euryale.AAC.1
MRPGVWWGDLQHGHACGVGYIGNCIGNYIENLWCMEAWIVCAVSRGVARCPAALHGVPPRCAMLHGVVRCWQRPVAGRGVERCCGVSECQDLSRVVSAVRRSGSAALLLLLAMPIHTRERSTPGLSACWPIPMTSCCTLVADG